MSSATVDQVEELAQDDAEESITMTSGIASLLPFAQGARGPFAISIAIASVATLLGLAPYWVIYRAVDEVVRAGSAPEGLTRLAILALVAILVRFLLLGVAITVAHVGAYRVLYEIRMALAEHLARVPLGYVTRRRSGEIKKVMGDDVERLELFLAHGVPDATSGAITLFAIAAWMFSIDARVAIAAVGLVVPAFVCMSIAMKNASPHMGEYHGSLSEMNAAIVELIRGMPVVKVFNRADDEVRGTETTVRRYVRTVRAYSLDFLPFGTAFYVLLAANAAAIAPVGGWLWSRGELSTPDLLFFFVVGLGALTPLITLLHLFANLSHLTTGGNLIRDIMEASVLVEEDVEDDPADSSIEVRDVSFAYDDHDVLHGVSFRADRGTLTALVGPSGSGKSTVASLVARFWDVRSGEILLGGVDIRRLSLDNLTRHVSVVLQDTFLFDDTIAANLRVGRPDATQAEIEQAARDARAHDFITKLPLGYETTVGELGSRLSGGERQRLAIARAMLADAPVVVLDEATSFADPENEAALQEAIGRLVEGKTVLVIAHRLTTVVGADRILVLDEGRIVERGQHDDLVSQGGLYARLWDDFNAASATSLKGAGEERIDG